jgi:peptidoglycan/LPS O-acetylase OafA/YrhL
MLLTSAELCKNRRRALRLISPLLTLVMTAAVWYLFIAYQPNGPEIADVFVVKYQYLMGEIRERM